MTITFSLKSKTRGKLSPILIRVVSGTHDHKINTCRSVCPENWNARTGEPKRAFMSEDIYSLNALAEDLDRIQDAVAKFVIESERIGRQYNQHDLKAVVAAANDKTDAVSSEIPQDIASYIDYLIGKMKSGEFRFRGDRYSDSTIKSWLGFLRVYERFDMHYLKKFGEILIWERIDKRAADEFIKFCEGCGYMTKTINRHILTFKCAIKYAQEHGLHDNNAYSFFHNKREVQGCTQTKVYLTTKEINALYQMKLEKGSLEDQVRDVFLMGCYTCQRISDYGRLSRDMFTRTASGTNIICLTQIKTKTTVCVPILNDNLLTLLEKYDYCAPAISDVIINRYIKLIAKRLSKSVPSLAEKVKTTLTLREKRKEEAEKSHIYERDDFNNIYKPKYELICTHTARRSGITNLYKSGLFNTVQMMSISGHKTESHFFEYISQSAEELADEIYAIQKKARQQESNEHLF